MANRPSATAAQDQAHEATQTQRTTFATFPEGVPCIIVLPGRRIGRHKSQDRYLNKKGGFTAQRRLARRFGTRADAIAPANQAWGRVIGVLLIEPADPAAGLPKENLKAARLDLLGIKATQVGLTGAESREFVGGVREKLGRLENKVHRVRAGRDLPGKRAEFSNHGKQAVNLGLVLRQGGTSKMVPPPALAGAGAGLPPAAGPAQVNSARKEKPSTAALAGLVPTAVAPTGTGASVAAEPQHQSSVGVSAVPHSGANHERIGLGRIAASESVRSRTRAATPAELSRLTAELHA